MLPLCRRALTGQGGADTYSSVTNRNGAPASASKSRAAAADSDATAIASPAFVGVEHHLLGLSPQYWAHTPLLIGDILSLGLVNGVDCMMSASPHSPNTTNSQIRKYAFIIIKSLGERDVGPVKIPKTTKYPPLLLIISFRYLDAKLLVSLYQKSARRIPCSTSWMMGVV